MTIIAFLAAIGAGLTMVAVVPAARWHAAAWRRRRSTLRVLAHRTPRSGYSRLRDLELRVATLLGCCDRHGRLSRLLVEAELSIESSTLIVRVGCLIMVVTGAALAMVREPVIVIFAGALVPGLTYAWLVRRRSQSQERLAQQLPDALTTVSNSLLAGASLPQAIEQTATECRRPVSSVLWRAVDGYRVGRSFETVLTELKNEIEMPMLEIALAAMLIHRQAGGSLGELLADAAELMRDDLRLRRDLKVATAQAKLSAQVVGALPILLVAAQLIFSPSSLEPFFVTGMGKLVFCFAGALELVGFFLIVRASSVRF